MNRRVVSILIALAATFTLVVGCAAPQEPAASEEGAAPEAPTGDAVECVVVSGMAMYPEGGDSTLFNPYVHYLSDASQRDPALKNRLQVIIRDAGSLYNQNDALTALSQGAVQLTYGGPHYFEQWDPAWKLLEAPGVIDDWAHFMRVMETDAFVGLVEELADDGVTLLNWIGNIGDVYCYTDEKIEGIDGIAGLSIRYFAGEAQALALTALGASAIFLPYTEVVTALQTHQLNGIWTDMPSAYNFYQLYRYCPNVLPYPISIQPLAMICNTEWLDSLDSSGDIMAPGMRESFTRTFSRIETWRDGDRMANYGAEMYLAQPGAYSPPFDETEFRQMQQIMKDAQAEMFSEIDPKYMAAIDSVRGSTAPWSPVSPLIR